MAQSLARRLRRVAPPAPLFAPPHAGGGRGVRGGRSAEVRVGGYARRPFGGGRSLRAVCLVPRPRARTLNTLRTPSSQHLEHAHHPLLVERRSHVSSVVTTRVDQHQVRGMIHAVIGVVEHGLAKRNVELRGKTVNIGKLAGEPGEFTAEGLQIGIELRGRVARGGALSLSVVRRQKYALYWVTYSVWWSRCATNLE